MKLTERDDMDDGESSDWDDEGATLCRLSGQKQARHVLLRHSVCFRSSRSRGMLHPSLLLPAPADQHSHLASYNRRQANDYQELSPLIIFDCFNCCSTRSFSKNTAFATSTLSLPRQRPYSAVSDPGLAPCTTNQRTSEP